MYKFLLAFALAQAANAYPADVGFIAYENYTLIENKVAVCPEELSVYARGNIFLRCGNNNRSWKHLADAVPKGTKFYSYSVEGPKVVVYFR